MRQPRIAAWSPSSNSLRTMHGREEYRSQWLTAPKTTPRFALLLLLKILRLFGWPDYEFTVVQIEDCGLSVFLQFSNLVFQAIENWWVRRCVHQGSDEIVPTEAVYC